MNGLVDTTLTWLCNTARVDLIRRQIDACARVRPNLSKHAQAYPTPGALRAAVDEGEARYGTGIAGTGEPPRSSSLLLDAMDKPESRSIWVNVWGGASTLAQAPLNNAHRQCSARELANLVSRLRLCTISNQDNGGPRLRLGLTNRA